MTSNDWRTLPSGIYRVGPAHSGIRDWVIANVNGRLFWVFGMQHYCGEPMGFYPSSTFDLLEPPKFDMVPR